MREILSHGKRVDNGEWVEGFYVHLFDHKGHESHRIYTGYAETDCGDFYPEWYEVDSESIGRYTGLTDKKGVNIFEGDIIFGKSWLASKEDRFVIRWRERSCEFSAGEGKTWWPQLNQSEMSYYEVIGNIHDNPELLEETSPRRTRTCKKALPLEGEAANGQGKGG